MTDVNRAWVAGILEGEGCFSIRTMQKKTGTYHAFCVKLAMTDRDIVERFHSIVGFGKFRGPVVQGGVYKDIYIWTITGQKKVKEMCEAMLPLMGIRRSAKICEVLSGIEVSPPKPGWRHGTRWGYEKGCKCEFCRAAHAKRFMERRRNAGVPERNEVQHGTRAMYVKHKCRCAPCVESNRAYARSCKVLAKSFSV